MPRQPDVWEWRPALISVSLLGGLFVLGGVMASGDGCFFDPPPGDYGALVVVNDTVSAVHVFQCDDEACDSGYGLQRVGAGHQTDDLYELCSGVSHGVTGGSGQLIGCFGTPVRDPDGTARFTVTEPCKGSTAPVYPRIPPVH